MFKLLNLINFIILFCSSNANAALSCQQLFSEAGKGVKISKMLSPAVASELNLKAKSFEATGDAQQISEEVSDLVMMMAHARSPIISDKEINQKGKLLLGLPIGNGFVLELKYRSNSTFEDKFVLDHINLISPSGKQIDVSANPIDVYDDRKISKDRLNFEIGTYPDGFNINAAIPTLIKGDVLKEIQQLAPKLELLPKDVLRDLARESNLKELKSKANRAHMKYFIKRYSIRGVFKTLFKMVVYEPIKMLFTVGVVYFAVNSSGAINHPGNITEFLFPARQTEWVSKSLNDSINAEALPTSVKSQLKSLQADLANDPSTISQSKNNPPDQNAPKLQVTKEQYLWTTNVTDPNTGLTTSLIFISRDNKQGQISYVAMKVDPEKYKQLIAYIKSIGQFIPVSSEDMK